MCDESLGNRSQQRFVRVVKNTNFMSISLDLTDDLSIVVDQEDDFGTSIDGTRQMITERANITDDLILSLSNSGAADAFAHWNAIVLRRGTDIGAEHECVALQPINADPHVMREGLGN